MAFRLLQRASHGGTSAPSAAATAAAAGVASLSLTPLSTTHSDAAPTVSRGVSLVQLGSSWEDLLSAEHVESIKTSPESLSPKNGATTRSPPPLPADAPKAVAGCEGPKHAADKGTSQASGAKSGASSGESSGVFTTFSLAPPTRDETEAAMCDVEALFTKGVSGFLASPNSSWCEASATMEASERAIQRAQSLLAEDAFADTGSYYNVAAPDTIPPTPSPSASAAAAAGGPLSVRMLQPLSAASGAAAGAPSAALSASSFGSSSQMAAFMSKHRVDMGNILQDPKVWEVLIQNEHVREIMRKEGGQSVDGSTPSTPKSEADSRPKGEPRTGGSRGVGSNGMWEFLALVHAKLETLVANVKSILFAEPQEVKGAGAQGSSGKPGEGTARQYGESAPPSAWGMFGGILAVVVAVAFLVLLRRSRRGL